MSKIRNYEMNFKITDQAGNGHVVAIKGYADNDGIYDLNPQALLAVHQEAVAALERSLSGKARLLPSAVQIVNPGRSEVPADVIPLEG